MSYTGPNSQEIKNMFGSIANNYDKANNVLSLGIHNKWKKIFISYLNPSPGQKILDCATGTGDLALIYKDIVKEKGEVIGCDFCEQMIQEANNKKHPGIKFEIGDVTQLKYDNNYFDISSISFGIRNVDKPSQGLSEMARVVKPGGTVGVLEFGQMHWPLFKQLYSVYSTKVLPIIGGYLTGDRKAYQYLEDSSKKFPSGEDFVKLMASTQKFSNIEYKTFMGGLAYCYRATVI